MTNKRCGTSVCGVNACVRFHHGHLLRSGYPSIRRGGGHLSGADAGLSTAESGEAGSHFGGRKYMRFWLQGRYTCALNHEKSNQLRGFHHPRSAFSEQWPRPVDQEPSELLSRVIQFAGNNGLVFWGQRLCTGAPFSPHCVSALKKSRKRAAPTSVYCQRAQDWKSDIVYLCIVGLCILWAFA